MKVSVYRRTLPSGDISLYLDEWDNGKRSRKKLGLVIPKGWDKNNKKKAKEIESLAEARRSQRYLEMIKGEDGKIPDHLRNINFNDYSESFIKKYRKADIRIVASSISKFKEMVSNDWFKMSQITPTVMNKYKDYLIYDSGLSGETPHNYFTRFKKLLKKAKIDGIFKEMPTMDIKFDNPEKSKDLDPKQVLDSDELQILANTRCGNEEVKKAFLFACFTSLGLAEIRKLKWSNIQKGRVVTKREKTGSLINNKLSSVPLKLIGEPGAKNEYIFDIQDISTNGVNKNIKNWVKRSQLDKEITFYCARHTFACLLLEAGQNLKSVANAMGHKTINTTVKYLNHIQRLEDKGMDNLPKLQL